MTIDAVRFSCADAFTKLRVIDKAIRAAWANFLDALAELVIENMASWTILVGVFRIAHAAANFTVEYEKFVTFHLYGALASTFFVTPKKSWSTYFSFGADAFTEIFVPNKVRLALHCLLTLTVAQHRIVGEAFGTVCFIIRHTAAK